jgi:hypothetical protein
LKKNLLGSNGLIRQQKDMRRKIIKILIIMIVPLEFPHPIADENNYVKDYTDNSDNYVLTYRSNPSSQSR